MQTLELSPMLADATAKVLESMFFTGVLGEVSLSDKQCDSWVAAKLAFDGDPSGKFGIGLSPAAARSLTANFLGLEAEELSQIQIDEVIGELTNMIAGSFVSALEVDRCFALSHPEMEMSEECSRRLQSANSHVFELEDGLIVVWLEMNA